MRFLCQPRRPAGWLAACLGRLLGWLVAWIGCVVGWLAARAGCLTGWLAGLGWAGWLAAPAGPAKLSRAGQAGPGQGVAGRQKTRLQLYSKLNVYERKIDFSYVSF